MEPGHLLHSALTRQPSADARRLKSRHLVVPAAQQLISSSDNNNICAAQWADHHWNAEWTDNPTRLGIFIPDTGTHPPERTSQEEAGSDLIAPARVLGVFALVCTKERCRKSNNLWLRALMQSDCLYSSLFFEHYNRILVCD